MTTILSLPSRSSLFLLCGALAALGPACSEETGGTDAAASNETVRAESDAKVSAAARDDAGGSVQPGSTLDAGSPRASATTDGATPGVALASDAASGAQPDASAQSGTHAGQPASVAADAGGGSGPDEIAAVEAIKTAFHDNAYGRFEQLAMGIDAAAKSAPDDPTIARFAAVLRLWHLTEASRDPSITLIDEAPVLIEAQADFDTAKRLAPNDGRLQGWSAALTIRSGQLTDSAPQIEKGKQELEAAIASYPAFNLFVQGAALGALPRTDPDFDSAADKMYATLEACGYKLDRTNPVFAPDAIASPASGVCGNPEFAPHNIEGLFLNLGDVLTKAGKVDQAKVVYNNAKVMPSFASWPYRELLEKRIQQVAANAATYTDGDSTNDFKMPIEDGYFCVNCHATKL